MSKEVANALSVMCSPDGLCQRRADVNDAEFRAAIRLIAKGHSVGDDDVGQTALVERLDGVSGEDAVGDDGNDFSGSVIFHGLSGLGQSTAGIGHVVNENGNLVRNVSDKDHAADFIGARTLLVNQGEALVDAISDGSRPARRS